MFFAVGALAPRTELARAPAGASPASGALKPIAGHPVLGFGFIFIALMAGFRYRVGGDWGSYALWFTRTASLPYTSAIQITDPGYQTVSWVAAQWGGGVWLSNLICAAIFAWGLRRLVLGEPYPWLATLVAVPYLVIVVAMGYTRQSVAIGLLMAGMATLRLHKSMWRFVLFGIAATLFHKTAFLMIPVVLFGYRGSNLLATLIPLIVAGILYNYFVSSALPDLTRNYIDAQYQSTGAAIRLGIGAFCGAIFIIFRRRLNLDLDEISVWRNLSISTIFLFIALPFVSSSTVVDRIALYLFPLQIIVLGRIPIAINHDVLGKIAVLSTSIATLFVWANFGDNAFYWNPYRVVPLSIFDK